MAGRILIIRGGAIGDFILTLPAIRLIRQNLPETRIEVLGYPGIAQLALDPDHADAVHSIEYAPLARFFSRKPELDPAMVEFFTGFQQIVSYLYDPDGIFEENLRAAGVKNLLVGPGKLSDDLHAVQQLARPLEKLAFFLEDAAPRFSPSEKDHASAENFHPSSSGFIALHPGSGGKKKNWPVQNWMELASVLQAAGHKLLLVGGEAEEETLRVLEQKLHIPVVRHLPLRTLGALLHRSRLFIGHDSGISHLAAASGVRCLLLFGPTDPDIWAPLNSGVEILSAPEGTMESLALDTVRDRVEAFLKT